MNIDRRGRVAYDAAVGIHVGRDDGHGRRHVALQSRDVMLEDGRGRTVLVAEDVQSRLRIDDALVYVHGGTWFARHRLGHEGGVHIVFQGRFAQGALEEKHLVGQA
ncbi:hypothetical protein D9M68_917910 [compost metagenome]